MVPELFALHAPPVLILLLVLVIFNRKLSQRQDSYTAYTLQVAYLQGICSYGPSTPYVCLQDRDFVELFAGQAEVSKALRKATEPINFKPASPNAQSPESPKLQKP